MNTKSLVHPNHFTLTPAASLAAFRPGMRKTVSSALVSAAGSGVSALGDGSVPFGAGIISPLGNCERRVNGMSDNPTDAGV
jgi:hypothetical protein